MTYSSFDYMKERFKKSTCFFSSDENIFFYLVFSSKLQLICLIVYLIFIIYFMYNEIDSLFKLKLNYFCRFWSYIELGIIICSWTSVGIYIWRYQEYQQISSLYKFGGIFGSILL